MRAKTHDTAPNINLDIINSHNKSNSKSQYSFGDIKLRKNEIPL